MPTLIVANDELDNTQSNAHKLVGAESERYCATSRKYFIKIELQFIHEVMGKVEFSRARKQKQTKATENPA